jgi:hypothetical protein
MLDDAGSDLRGCLAIRRVERLPLARRKPLRKLAGPSREQERVRSVGARQRHEHLHCGVSHELAPANEVLDDIG